MGRLVRIMVLATATAGGLAGCGEDAPTDVAPPEVTPAAETQPAPDPDNVLRSPVEGRLEADGRLRIADIRLTVPPLWRKVPPLASLRAANLIVPGRDGADQAEVTFLWFEPGLGGTDELNIERWTQQFLDPTLSEPVEPAVETFTADDLEITVVRLEGQMRKQGADWYVPEQVMHAALVRGGEGLLVARLVGPSVTADAAASSFRTMLESAELVPDEDAKPDDPG